MYFNKFYLFFSFWQWIVKKVSYCIGIRSISVNYPENQIQESPSIYFILFPHTKSEKPVNDVPEKPQIQSHSEISRFRCVPL